MRHWDIRPAILDYNPAMASTLTDLYFRSVRAIDPSIYSQEEKEAWAAEPIDYRDWALRFEKNPPYVAALNGLPVGFITLEKDGHIDLAYVDPEFQRKGLMQYLYDFLEKEAHKRQLRRLFVEASKVARPFFEKQGFHVESENQINRNGIILINYSMGKWL